jgi:uncharacterized membrane protein
VFPINWAHAGPAILAAFLASLVEFVEALTIVLAVGTTRGWRPALLGAGLGIVMLTGMTLLFGPALQAIPIHWLQLVIGLLLLLFGMRWLRKAILRASGALALHDEVKIYAKEVDLLSQRHPTRGALFRDKVAVLTAFKAVVLEGLEVVFIVLATGSAAHAMVAASVGAAAAGMLIVGLGILLHRPLARVPENTLKFSVGILLSTFGAFWTGEGFGFSWPGEDLSILGLAAAYVVASLFCIVLIRRARQLPALSA